MIKEQAVAKFSGKIIASNRIKDLLLKRIMFRKARKQEFDFAVRAIKSQTKDPYEVAKRVSTVKKNINKKYIEKFKNIKDELSKMKKVAAKEGIKVNEKNLLVESYIEYLGGLYDD